MLCSAREYRLAIPPRNGPFGVSSAETVWPKMRDFWLQNGFLLTMDDPAVGIRWPETRAAPLLSAKDRTALPLTQVEVFA